MFEKGRKHTEETIRKMRIAKIGKPPLPRTPEWIQHLSESIKKWHSEHPRPRKEKIKKKTLSPEERILRCPRGNLHFRWLASPTAEKNYNAIHNRIRKAYGRANRCTNPNCSGKSKRFDWSNNDHKYSQNIEDWTMLCFSCHKKHDWSLKKIKCGFKKIKYNPRKSKKMW